MIEEHEVSARSGVGGLLVADLLAGHGIQGIPAPLRTRSGQPWSTLGPDRVSLTSWIQGSRGVDAPMADSHWRSFGALLAQVHAVDAPASVQAELPREDHTTAASATVRALQARVLAPRERDLLFVVHGVIAAAPVSSREQAWFFEGYGPTDLDPVRLGYYRCSWALQDVAGYASNVLEDRWRPPQERAHALASFRSLLSPSGIVELALKSIRELRSLGHC